MSSATDDEAEINLTRRATLESNSDALQGSQAPPPPVDPEREYDTEDEAGDGALLAAAERRAIRAERRKLLLTSPAFVIGSLIVAFWILCAIAPGMFTQWGPNEVVRLADGSTIPRTAPSADAWFGTDAIGNDVYARVIYGARPVLILAPIAAALSVVAGTLLGLVMGYVRGWTDEIMSRIIEAFLSIPVILLALMVLVIFGRSRLVIIITIAVLFTPVVTRTVRSTVMAEAQLDYVTSAKLRGENNLYVMVREILPNITSVIVVEFTVRVGYAIFTVATLAFLGLTADDATSADWGRDVANNYSLIQADQWWPSVFPALAIASLVIAVNLIADSLDRVSKA
jgi:peptide/nickel transport system permease protein